MLTQLQFLHAYNKAIELLPDIKESNFRQKALGNIVCGSTKLESLILASKFRIGEPITETTEALYKCLLDIIGNPDIYFFREANSVFVTTYEYYDGKFTQSNGHLFLTHSTIYNGKVTWSIDVNNLLIVITE